MNDKRFDVDATPDVGEIDREAPAADRPNRIPSLKSVQWDTKKMIVVGALGGSLLFAALTVAAGIGGNDKMPQIKAKPPAPDVAYDPETVIAPTLQNASHDPNAPVHLTGEQVPAIAGAGMGGSNAQSSAQTAAQRRAAEAQELRDSARRSTLIAYNGTSGQQLGARFGMPGDEMPQQGEPQGAASNATPLDALKRTSTVGRTSARMIGDRNYLVTAGSIIPCTLQTAMDSSVPGYATCIVPRDIYSDNPQCGQCQTSPVAHHTRLGRLQICQQRWRSTIGDNTTVNLTGSLTPGATRDLIVVNGGGAITGDFDIVNRDPGIVGVLRNNGTTLQLLGTFVAPTGISTQANAAVGYVNDLLIAGTASTALINAVPALLSGGTANAAAFGQLTPEAYASASQLGVEQGLALAKAGRAGLAETTRETAGLFSFAQGLGDWRTLKGRGSVGTSTAKSHSYGLVGGIGFGSATGSIGAFIGYIDSRQTIARLGARTNSDGLVAGLSGHFMSGGFDGTVTIAYDWSEANTRRSVPGATALSGDYRLRSLVLDGTVGYSFPMGIWAVHPEVGVTHISTRRGSASETGSAAFALTVDGRKTSATFVDGAIKLKGGMGESTMFHPWASVGLRHQLEGERSTARAGFVGNAERFTVFGAGRKETMATLGAGASYDLAAGLSLYGAYQGEFGGGQSHNVNVGVRFAF